MLVPPPLPDTGGAFRAGRAGADPRNAVFPSPSTASAGSVTSGMSGMVSVDRGPLRAGGTGKGCPGRSIAVPPGTSSCGASVETPASSSVSAAPAGRCDGGPAGGFAGARTAPGGVVGLFVPATAEGCGGVDGFFAPDAAAGFKIRVPPSDSGFAMGVGAGRAGVRAAEGRAEPPGAARPPSVSSRSRCSSSSCWRKSRPISWASRSGERGTTIRRRSSSISAASG